MKEKRFVIKGMHCASCVAKIENKLKSIKGVEDATVNLMTEKAAVKYNKLTDDKKIEAAVRSLGYEVLAEETDNKKDISDTKKRLVAGAVLSAIIFVGSFPEIFNIQLLNNSILLFVLATPVQFWVGLPFYRGLVHSLRNKTADMNTLIAVGTSAAYLYSSFVAFFPQATAAGGMYFDTAAVIITLILLGRYMEAISKGKASEAVKKLIGLKPKAATVIRKGREMRVPAEQIEIGDIVVIKPGEKIPTDGIVVDGHSTVDESMITGESIPVEKNKNDTVIGATINKNGVLRIKATKIGKDTVLSQIINLVEGALSSKAPIQRMADKIASYFVPAVIIIALASSLLWAFLGTTLLTGTALSAFVTITPLVFGLTIFIAVIIIACPCALGLATPTAIMVGMGKASEHGILIKNAEALETARRTTTVVFDKTGTLTKGLPEVTDIVTINGDEKDVLKLAAIAEKGSEHPLAEAIVKEAKNRKIQVPKASHFQSVTGKGVVATYNRKKIVLGNRAMMKEVKIRASDIEKSMSELEDQGKTVMIVVYDRKILGMIAVADTPKEHATEAVERLHKMGKEVVMLTGDNERTAKAIANHLNIDSVIAGVLPHEKSGKIKSLQKKGKVVAMVGDGINDAPALAQADLGIAIGSGTDVALETGSVVLIKNDVRDVITAIDLSAYTVKKIKQNLFWAFAYNTALIPIAAGALFPSTGLLLNPMIAGGAMALSSVSVVSNSLLMKRYKAKIR
ncbi:copper-translocating P-type ATPase [archaeon]|nr:copper-translocating P-type ATPase [archaeon]